MIYSIKINKFKLSYLNKVFKKKILSEKKSSFFYKIMNFFIKLLKITFNLVIT